MRHGQIGRSHRPKLIQKRRRFVVFRYDGDEVTVGDLVLIGVVGAVAYVVLCVWLVGAAGFFG